MLCLLWDSKNTFYYIVGCEQTCFPASVPDPEINIDIQEFEIN